MPTYYVNRYAQKNGEHVVHRDECTYMPMPENCILLGTFDNCNAAVREAKRLFSKCNGCSYCSHNCHRD